MRGLYLCMCAPKVGRQLGCRGSCAGFPEQGPGEIHSHTPLPCMTNACPLWLCPPQVMGIAGVDTRAITRRLRVTGCLNGAITTDSSISGACLG